ncbi:MAG TPA: hypothetical protein VG412_09290 [Acidimicrobiales bacterium]|nr:hypothetical protein [Acidimicrobiales bacterium]
MSAHRIGRGARGAGAAVQPSPRITPFWILQVAEILSVLALADLSLHVSRGGVLVVAGAVFAALALTADGPLGIFRIFGRKLHVRLVVVAAVLVAVSPVVAVIRPDVEGIIILEFVAVGIIRLATLVNTDPRPARPRARRGGPVVDATATATVAPSSPAPSRPDPSAPSGRSLLPSEESVGAAARWAGRAAGTAASAASRTSAKHAPATKAQAKRTIRTAGRLVGRARATSRSDGTIPEPG